MQAESVEFASVPYSTAESLQFHGPESPGTQHRSGAMGAQLVPPHVVAGTLDGSPERLASTARAEAYGMGSARRDSPPHQQQQQSSYYEAQRRGGAVPSSPPRAASATASISMPMSARSGAERRTARDHNHRVRMEQEAVQHRATLKSSASLALAQQLASLPAQDRVKLGYQLLKERQARTSRTSAIFASTTERLNPHGRGPRKPEHAAAAQGVVVVAGPNYAVSGVDRSFGGDGSPHASPKSPHSLSSPASPRRISGNVMVGPAAVTPQAERAIRLELERRAALALKLNLDFNTLRPHNQPPHPGTVGSGIKNAGAPFGRTTGPRGSLRCPDRALTFLAERSEMSPAPSLRGSPSPSGAVARLTSPMGPAALTRFLASPGPGQYADPLAFVGA